jgi:hypothetical protein|tara:strand:+ start:2738 stop:3517 length:780 start_codon:yes stop_codon:yes gene_type:complete
MTVVGVLMVIVFMLFVYIKESEKNRIIDRNAVIKKNEEKILIKEEENLIKEEESLRKIYTLKLNHTIKSILATNREFEDEGLSYGSHNLLLRKSKYRINIAFEPKYPDLKVSYSVATWKKIELERDYTFELFSNLNILNMAMQEDILPTIMNMVYKINKEKYFRIDPFKESSEAKRIYINNLREGKDFKENNIIIMDFNFGYSCSVSVSSPVEIKVFEQANLNENLINEVYDYYWRSGCDKKFILNHFKDENFSNKRLT